jgi:hypothetical protein
MSFAHELILPTRQGIVIAHVALDLFLGPVFLRIGVGDGVSFVSVGVDLQHGGPALVVGAIDGGLGAGADFVKILAIDLLPLHAVGFSAGGEAFGVVGAGALLAGAHRVAVVFDHVDHRQIPQLGQVERLVDRHPGSPRRHRGSKGSNL